ncbi:DUF1284 domain-containing protein [Donghicola tyrosinivorans]|uniref:DUF1284 domain-containing protein n=1 Tax=Donghicola tyrosinivorans TaxID=1652492 RepID=A0A2T0WX54_9RHOB|nr:DUF1284 domain-containing protein [Donghicola tyrosinivorans]PRY91269.1 hypothetical protein CLV74_104290 [Donghicola tyrosinivorans]
MSVPLTFRPHHFLCALGYRGKGYSDDFTANMTRIVTDGLFAPDGDTTLITVRLTADSICTPCPKRRGEGCTAGDKITALDQRHARAIGLTGGETLTWSEAKSRIKANVRPADLNTLCAGCQWLDLGLCHSALEELHSA